MLSSRRPALAFVALVFPAFSAFSACGAAPLPAPAPVVFAPPFLAPPRAPDWTIPPLVHASRELEVTLAPQRDPSGEIASIEVALRLTEPPGEFGDASPLVLVLHDAEAGEAGWPDAIEDLYVRDGEGALSMGQKPVPATGDAPAHTEWRSARHPSGAISITYRARAVRAEPGKFQGLRAHAGGVQGTGSTFLLLPETPSSYVTHIGWALDDAGDEVVGLSSFGEGSVDAVGPFDRILAAVYMAGSLGRLSLDDGSTHFHGAWLGKPGFDPGQALTWASAARAAERALFRDADPESFSFFLRAVPRLGPTWAVTARPQSFLLLAGDELAWTRPARFAVAFELARPWIGGAGTGIRFEGKDGSAAWFTEGVAVHVARALLLRAGLCTPAEFADDLRERAERFALSPVPADRGMLYAAEVDAAVRAKSGGKRSLDDLLLGLLEQARALGKAAEGAGKDGAPVTLPLPAGAFRDLVGGELGPDAVGRYDAVITRGEPPAPPSDAYGPCFKSAKKKLPRDAKARGGDAIDALVWVRDPKIPDASCAR